MEHAFAALKGRFQSLRELRLRICSPDDLDYAIHWVQCCIILHNMVIRFEDVLGKESSTTWARAEAQDIARDPEQVAVTVIAGTAGQRFRVHLMRQLFTALGMAHFVVNERQ